MRICGFFKVPWMLPCGSLILQKPFLQRNGIHLSIRSGAEIFQIGVCPYPAGSMEEKKIKESIYLKIK